MQVLNNSCVDCHETLSPFTDEESRLNDIRITHIEKKISCSLECHEDVIRRTATDNFHQWSESEHSRYFVTCDDCHGGNPKDNTKDGAHTTLEDINDPNSTIYFKNIPDTCGKCHAEELDHFKNTMHFQRLRGTAHGPSCVTCHQPHHFKVLKASEMIALCSICHNVNDQFASAGVPKDAKEALEKQKEFQDEFLLAMNAVADAKASGMDVSIAEMDLNKALAVKEDIPSLWHGFDLGTFDDQVQNGIELSKRAQYRVSGAEPTIPSTRSTGIGFLLGILIIIYLIRKR